MPVSSSRSNTEHTALSTAIGVIVIMFLVIGGIYVFNQRLGNTDSLSDETPTMVEPASVSLLFENMPSLVSGYYEVWIQVPSTDFASEEISLGKFNINEFGRLVDTEGTIITDNKFFTQADIQNAQRVRITIESAGDSDSGPSETVFLHGELEEGLGALEFTTSGLDMSTGTFVLATPSDGPDTNETSGVWFVSLSEDNTNETAGLILPPLPSEWKYEGWIVVDGAHLSMGQFQSPQQPDNFNRYSGDQPVPPYPGEDFLQNPPEFLVTPFPLDLVFIEADVFVTIEHELETAEEQRMPSLLRVFEAKITADMADHTNYPLDNVARSNLPAGLVVVKE